MDKTDQALCAAQAEKETELLSFIVGDQDYSVDIMSVREIRSASKATPLPRSPSYVLGVINLRGTVLPILDLSLRLGMDRSAELARNVIIVVAIGDKTLGLLVDAVSDILSVAADDLQPPPDMQADAENQFVSALTIFEDRMIRILDLDSVLPTMSEEAA
ncbi:chemotaxis protein CheW [Aliiroseovarius sp. CAU 1755]